MSHAIVSSMQYYPEDIIVYAIMSAGRFAYAMVSARTLLHSASVSARTLFAYAALSAPVQNRPCSKLNALGRRNTFAISQAKCMSWMTWEMFGRWVFTATIKVREYSCCIRRFSACMLLTRAHTCTVMYMSNGRILHSPDTIAYAKVSGADSIAWRTQLHLTPALENSEISE